MPILGEVGACGKHGVSSTEVTEETRRTRAGDIEPSLSLEPRVGRASVGIQSDAASFTRGSSLASTKELEAV